jgi:5-methylthioadenosine/S-adenosylhomocysteine deaminase
MSETILIKGGTLITVDPQDRILEADLLIENGRISHIIERDEAAQESLPENLTVIDAAGKVILPGFVQTHIHLCQTIMRGAADDLSLMDWLKKRVWRMEAAHTPTSLYASARLGIAELIAGGTTTALTMETVNYTEQVFRAVEESGFRATVGKCMMDKGDEVPAALSEQTKASIYESLQLLEEWHGRDDGRIRYGFAPRFAVSCTRELLEEVAGLARDHDSWIHTHASESQEEIAIVKRESGRDNIQYLHAIGLTGRRAVLAHCVWATDEEIELLAATKTNVAHCPSSNLKLGSGIARVVEMLGHNVNVSLGADGAPCNNRLDMLTELRTAALLQKVRCGPDALPARQALRMATIDGARALELEEEIGSIEEGKRADLLILNVNRLHLTPRPDVVSSLVYAAERSEIETVLINGKIVLQERQLTTMDEEEVKAAALEQFGNLLASCQSV